MRPFHIFHQNIVLELTSLLVQSPHDIRRTIFACLIGSLYLFEVKSKLRISVCTGSVETNEEHVGHKRIVSHGDFRNEGWKERSFHPNSRANSLLDTYIGARSSTLLPQRP